MFHISTQVKYTHIYLKKTAILIHETNYMTFINIRNSTVLSISYLVMSIHVSMSIGFKVIARRFISANGCLISIIISYFSHIMLSFISYLNPWPWKMWELTPHKCVYENISFTVSETILFLGSACLICIIINKTATSGNGNCTFPSPWVLIVNKKELCPCGNKYLLVKLCHSTTRLIGLIFSVL